jgi:hypothetical protein
MGIQGVAQQMIPDPTLAGSGVAAASRAVATSQTPTGDSCGALLPEPSLVGGLDIGAEIALLSIRAGRDEEIIQQKSEEAENRIQDVAEQNEVQEMHTEATDIMSSAVLSGVMQIAQGACQIAAGSVTVGSAASGNAPNTTGASSAQGSSQSLVGMGTLLGAGASFATAQGQSQRELDEALIASYKAVSDRAGQLSQEASQGQTDARSVIANAVQFYQQYVETEGQIDGIAAGQKA